MSEAPERIWIDGENYYDTFNPNGKNEVEYVRADIAASQLAEALAGNAEYSRKWWQAERELLAVKAERDRWKGEYLNACRDAASFSGDLVKAEAERDRLAAEVTRLKEALCEHVTENVWNAYHIGIERDGRWMDGARSEGEWLARELELPDGWNDAALVKSMLPGLINRIVTRAAIAEKD